MIRTSHRTGEREGHRARRALTVGVSIAALAASALSALPGPAFAGTPGASKASPGVTPTAAYAWATADQQSNPSPYHPAAATQFNSATTTSATVTRSSTGVYSVFFPGLSKHHGTGDGSGGTAFVSQANCKTTGWGPVRGGETVGVACFREPGTANQGQPADSVFTVGLTNRSATASYPVSFAFANLATGTYTPSATYRFNYGAGVTVSNTATGAYTVTFANRSAVGIPKVTAFGLDNVLCNLTGWSAGGTSTKIKVLCFDGTGAAANSQFVVQLGQQNALFGDSVLNDAGLTNATPGVSWSFRSGVGFLPSTDYSITTSFTGIYKITLKNQTPNTHYTWNITTVGPGGRYCSSNSPDATQPGDLVFSVTCFDGATLKNAKFTFEFNAN
jgi:hypothetical protein